MSKVYFTSDLHLGHNNLCETIRGMSAKESDALIIRNWNKVIKEEDIIFVLGDLTMNTPKLLKYYLSQLKGNIKVIAGNHDTYRCCQELYRLNIPVAGTIKYNGYLCTHIPIAERELAFCRGNIHGHIHLPMLNEMVEKPYKPLAGKYFNVNCELHNYTPVLFEDILKFFSKL